MYINTASYKCVQVENISLACTTTVLHSVFPVYLDVKMLIVFLSHSSQIMDRLIWYLRIVHSVDYYTATAFPSEDCMPHRCGIITARGQKPNAVTQEEGTATWLSNEA